MSAKKQMEKEIREAYIFLRTNTMTIPSETLQFMLDSSLEALKKTTEESWKHIMDKFYVDFQKELNENETAISFEAWATKKYNLPYEKINAKNQL